MPKESLKDKVEGNELDLGLSELTVIPVKELAALPKATHLDFSCNLLTSIPPDFCRLQHIVKLDLSKNSLTSLPENFGQLQKLKHLDLFANQLTSLPVSFCHLKNLKWLDLKDNPLEEPLNTIAGDCLDSQQCQKCAVNVITYMKKVQSELEKLKQKRLAEERELEAAKKAEEQREIERVRAEKKAARLRRKEEVEAQKAIRQAAREVEVVDEEKVESCSDISKSNGIHQHQQKDRSGFDCCGVFISFIFGIVVIAIGLYFYCETRKDDKMCHATRAVVTDYYVLTQQFVNKTMNQITEYLDKK